MADLYTNNSADLMNAQKALGIQGPAFFNFHQDNTRNLARIISDVSSGQASGKIAIIGDSTDAGHGSSGGPFYGARARSWSSRLAAALASNGIPILTSTLFGCSNLSTILGTSSPTMQTFDPRVTFGSGWAIHAQYTAGGRFFTAPAGTTEASILNFGSQVWDTSEIWYFRNGGLGSFVVDRAGAAPVSGSPVNTAGTNSLQKATLSWSAAASGVLNLSNVTVGTVNIMGVVVRNSAAPAVEIYNLGIGGSNSADWNDTRNVYTPKNMLAAIAPDVTFIGHGVNDWNTGNSSVYSNAAPTNLTTYTNNIQAEITARKAAGGDVILKGGIQSDPTNFASKALQQQYLDAMRALAVSNDIPMMDFQVLGGDYSVASARGYMSDQRHGSIRGYDIQGRAVARVLRAVAA